MNEIIWFDTETTGITETDEIITLAMLLEGTDKAGDEYLSKKLFEIQPTDVDAVSDEAIAIRGITRNQMKNFWPAEAVFPEIVKFLDEHINRKNKNDKSFIGGYNVKFDIDMLAKLFRRFDKFGFGCYTHWGKLDPLSELYLLKYEGLLPDLPNLKLETVCEKFGIEIAAHDAMSNIEATRELMVRILTKRKQTRERPA